MVKLMRSGVLPQERKSCVNRCWLPSLLAHGGQPRVRRDRRATWRPAARSAPGWGARDGGLADDWKANRLTCVDVLCAYLRMPYELDPGDTTSAEKQLAFRAMREVCHSVIRVITAHLKGAAAVSWQGPKFDLTGVVFDGGD